MQLKCSGNFSRPQPQNIINCLGVCVCACVSSIVLVIRFDIDKIRLITIDSSNAWNSPCVAYASVMNFHIHHAEIFMLFSFRMHIPKILRLTIANFPYSLIYLSHSLCPRLAVPLWFNAYVVGYIHCKMRCYSSYVAHILYWTLHSDIVWMDIRWIYFG